MTIKQCFSGAKAPSQIVALTLSTALACAAAADSRTQAKRLHDRIAGVPPTEAVLADMAGDIAGGNLIDAAYTAMDNRYFYDVTVKNLVAPWTNEAQSSFVSLNDYTATVIGMVRDDRDFRNVLSGDLIYVGDPSLSLPAYSMSNNDHYETLEDQGHSLRDYLVAVTQSSVNGLPAAATAGVMTTRAAARAYFSGGTNRAMLRFTLMNHLCNDLEQLQDDTRSPDRIRQDVTRSPGGDSSVFLTNCITCHSGMDPLAQAFAYYEFDYDMNADPDGSNGTFLYQDGVVQGKYLINSTNFEYGFVTPDDEWNNYWREGKNTFLGWDESLPNEGSGNGAKSLGQELAYSDAFAQCHVEQVFEAMCLRPPSDAADRQQVSDTVVSFAANGYQMKRVFAETAAYCIGD